MKNLKLAVVGATGNVGREILQILADTGVAAKQVTALASERSQGVDVSYGDDDVLPVQDLSRHDFRGTSIVFLCTTKTIAAEYAPKIAATGAVVIDHSGQFTLDPDVPLVVPEINEKALAGFAKKHIIATPNCVAIQIAMALKSLHDAAGVRRVVASTYQSVSGAGKDAMDELFRQTRSIFVNDQVEMNVFTKQIAYNLIPQIGDFMDDGTTTEEWDIMTQTKKILDPAIKITTSCVRVPVFIGHAVSLNIECTNAMDSQKATALLKKMPGVSVVDHRAEGGFVTPVEIAGEDKIFISRIRDDQTAENSINLWVVADNLRKGAALNAVQIAMALAKSHLHAASAA